LYQSLQLCLQCLQGRIWLSLTLECTVCGILDRQSDVTVLDGLRTWLGGLDRLELDRHEGELLNQVGVAVQRLEDRRVRRSECVGLLRLGRGNILQEIECSALVLGVLGDGKGVTTKARNARTGDARQRRY